ncbi:MAG: hypothetical protein WBB28_01755 [Crinalium sp.]
MNNTENQNKTDTDIQLAVAQGELALLTIMADELIRSPAPWLEKQTAIWRDRTGRFASNTAKKLESNIKKDQAQVSNPFNKTRRITNATFDKVRDIHFKTDRNKVEKIIKYIDDSEFKALKYEASQIAKGLGNAVLDAFSAVDKAITQAMDDIDVRSAKRISQDQKNNPSGGSTNEPVEVEKGMRSSFKLTTAIRAGLAAIEEATDSPETVALAVNAAALMALSPILYLLNTSEEGEKNKLLAKDALQVAFKDFKRDTAIRTSAKTFDMIRQQGIEGMARSVKELKEEHVKYRAKKFASRLQESADNNTSGTRNEDRQSGNAIAQPENKGEKTTSYLKNGDKITIAVY